MLDINESYQIEITQSVSERAESSGWDLLFLSTDHSPPCFGTLRFMNQIQHPELLVTSRNIYRLPHLSSDILVQRSISREQSKQRAGEKHVRQGPSMEYWNEFCESGEDNVLSIHCPFWPNGSTEWINRSRPFGWPTQRDISSVVEFGCHIVPVGHPLSPLKEMEWRISFSIAERILVWSFNHVQMQCYAVMKIILKEFIKARCSPQSQVLCSYFIKTFLFWEFESKDLHFWRRDNLRECIIYIMIRFFECLREGVIRHYFFPRFNLLSIKLTREAHTEIIQLFDIALQTGVGIVRECPSLRSIWTKLITTDDNMATTMRDLQRQNILRNDECMMQKHIQLQQCIFNCTEPIISRANYLVLVQQINTIGCKTDL